MKRIVFLLLSLLILLTSCSSSLEGAVTEGTFETKSSANAEEKATEEKEPDISAVSLPEGFSAGFGQEIADPQEGVGLGGYSTANIRLSKVILDHLKVSCTAISDGKNVFLFYSMDFLYVSESILNSVAKRMTDRYPGIHIPEENVMMNASHTHAAPAIHSENVSGMGLYLKKLYPALWRAADEAMLDLAPATLLAGETRTDGLSYVRRYVSKIDNSYLGNWPDPLSPDEARHETEADNQLQFLRFERGDKKDILLMNWQCHTTTVGSEMGTQVSADWVAPLRDTVEKEADVHFAFLQGSAGNIVPGSAIIGENKNSADHIKHGKDIAAALLSALDTAKPVKTGELKANRIRFSATLKEGGGKREFYMNVFSAGDVSFATVPCEYHDTLGMYVKENSPFPVTFMCAYTNGTNSYIPASFCWEMGGYEVNKMLFVRGTGEEMAEKLVEMLKEIHS